MEFSCGKEINPNAADIIFAATSTGFADIYWCDERVYKPRAHLEARQG